MKKRPTFSGARKLQQGVVQPGVIAAVGGGLGFESADAICWSDDSVQFAGCRQVGDDTGVARLVVEVAMIKIGVSNLCGPSLGRLQL